MKWYYKVIILLFAMVCFFYGLLMLEEIANAIEFGAPPQLLLQPFLKAGVLGTVSSLVILYMTYLLTFGRSK